MVKVVNIHSMEDPRQIVERIVMPRDGMVLVGSLMSNFLVSAGQTIAFGVSVTEINESLLASHWVDGRDLPAVKKKVMMDPTYDYRWIPSTRPLYAVLEDVVRHGTDFPSHGVDCICMDAYAVELRRHISRTLPLEEIGDTTQWAKVFDARARVRHVLRLAGNHL